jgi:cytochrome c
MGNLEFNKVFAALLVAGLVAMVSGILARALVEPEHLAENVIKLDTSVLGNATAGAPEAEAPLPPIAPLLASADPAAGEAVSKKCAACHNFVEGAGTKVGPDLYNIVGRERASMDFAYSSAMAEHKGEKWDFETLNAFLHNPKKVIPGTKMNFAGLAKESDRANLLAWLRQQSHDPVPLPAP